MGHPQALGVENMEGFGHCPEINLYYSSSVAFSDSYPRCPTPTPPLELSLAPTQKMALEFSQGQSLEGSGFSLSLERQVDLKPSQEH